VAWLTQNWIWIVLAVLVFVMLRRGGMGCGPRHAHQGHAHQGHADNISSRPQMPDRAAVHLDPVTGNAARTSPPITSYFGDRPYYFESSESREKFEASPEKYVGAAPAPNAPSSGHHRHRGC